jgi:hypothetical protein
MGRCDNRQSENHDRETKCGGFVACDSLGRVFHVNVQIVLSEPMSSKIEQRLNNRPAIAYPEDK